MCESGQSQQSILDLRKDRAVLHMKEYLQPFEKSVALLELDGLGFSIERIEGKHTYFTNYREEGKEGPFNRLSYFDQYNSNFTLQALREIAYFPNRNLEPSLPKRRVLRFPPHNIHEYRGKFFPQLVRALMNTAGLKTGSKVLDPFCGSGTTLAESRALNMLSFGLDTNPLSILISKVKTDIIGWSSDSIDSLSKFRDMNIAEFSTIDPEELWEENELVYLRRWFDPNALSEVAIIKNWIERIDHDWMRDFFKVSMSDIIRSVSFQSEDDLRVRKKPKTHVKGNVLEKYKRKVDENLAAIQRLLRVDNEHNFPFSLKLGDARKLPFLFPNEVGKIDAVITSPPYATALPYIDTDRLSLIVLGLLKKDELKETGYSMIGNREITKKMRKELLDEFHDRRHSLPTRVCEVIDYLELKYDTDQVGFRKRDLPALLSKYFLDMRMVLEGVKDMMTSGGQVFIIVGNNSTKVEENKYVIKTDELMLEIAEILGYSVLPSINMELLNSHDVFKINRGSKEQILRLSV